MTHASEAEIARAAEWPAGALECETTPELRAHLTTCAECRDALETQRIARDILATRPIMPVRDLSAAIRATLDAERPWFERLNWRVLVLRTAPVAVAMALVALLAVRAISATDIADVDPSVTTTAAATDAVTTGNSDHLVTAVTGANNTTVASALWSGKVSDDQLMTLFLRARAEDAVSKYVKEQ